MSCKKFLTAVSMIDSFVIFTKGNMKTHCENNEMQWGQPAISACSQMLSLWWFASIHSRFLRQWLWWCRIILMIRSFIDIRCLYTDRWYHIMTGMFGWYKVAIYSSDSCLFLQRRVRSALEENVAYSAYGISVDLFAGEKKFQATTHFSCTFCYRTLRECSYFRVLCFNASAHLQKFSENLFKSLNFGLHKFCTATYNLYRIIFSFRYYIRKEPRQNEHAHDTKVNSKLN